MLTHIVLFKLKENLTEAQKQQALKEIAEALSNLPEQIPEIQSYEVFINEADKGSDIGLIGTFKNFEDLNKYRNHPAHLKAVEIINKYKESGTSIDFTQKFSNFIK